MASYSDMGSERERIMALKKAYNNVDASSFTAEDNHALDTCLRTLKLAIWGERPHTHSRRHTKEKEKKKRNGKSFFFFCLCFVDIAN